MHPRESSLGMETVAPERGIEKITKVGLRHDVENRDKVGNQFVSAGVW
jgi:hypothetical protein